MFGSDGAGVLGTSSFAFDSNSSFAPAFFVFQLGFIGTATTLITGAVAERMRFASYLVMATFVTVHLSDRIAAAAAPGEVLVSATTRELAAGAGLVFSDRGAPALRGVREPKRLYSATEAGAER
jgi:ammonia channel protein AmtB